MYLDAGQPQDVEPSIYVARRMAHRPQKDRLATLLLDSGRWRGLRFS